MLRRLFAIMLTLAVWSVAVAQSAPQPKAQAGAAEKARAQVQKLGVGPKSRVEVKLLDGTVLKGSVSAAAEDGFNVTDAKTGATQSVSYADVARVKKQGGGLSTTSWIIIGAAAVTAVVVSTTVLYPVLCDGGAGC